MLADGADRLNPAIMDLPGNIYYHGYWIYKNWLRMLEEEVEFLNFQEITDDENSFQMTSKIILTRTNVCNTIIL